MKGRVFVKGALCEGGSVQRGSLDRAPFEGGSL